MQFILYSFVYSLFSYLSDVRWLKFSWDHAVMKMVAKEIIVELAAILCNAQR